MNAVECSTGVIADTCDTAVETECLRRIAEAVSIEFIKLGTSYDDSTAAASFFATSIKDSTISYDISLVDGASGWRVWSIAKHMDFLVPGTKEPWAVRLRTGVEPEVARQAIESVVPLLLASEIISSVALSPETGRTAASFDIESLDQSRRTPGGRVFRASYADDEYRAEKTGWWGL